MRTTLGDKILIVAFIFLNAVLFLKMGIGTTGDWVTIEVDQKEISRYPLSEDRVIPVNGRLGIMEVAI